MINFFKQCPDDVVVEILKCLTPLERIRLNEVCKRFKEITEKRPELNLTKKEKDELPTTLINTICDSEEEMNEAKKRGEYFSKYVTKQVNAFKHLFAVGANVNMLEGEDQSNQWKYNHTNKDRSLLAAAAYANKYDLAKLLLRKGAKVNYQDKDGFSALHLAARGGHAKLAKLLLDHGADPNLLDKNGKTPANLAEDSANNVNAHHAILFYFHALPKYKELAEAIRSHSGWEKLLDETIDMQPYLPLTRWDYT